QVDDMCAFNGEELFPVRKVRIDERAEFGDDARTPRKANLGARAEALKPGTALRNAGRVRHKPVYLGGKGIKAAPKLRGDHAGRGGHVEIDLAVIPVP